MIRDGSINEFCDHLMEELKDVAVDIEQTDKLASFLTKYYRSAPAYIDLIQKCIDVLISAKRKG